MSWKIRHEGSPRSIDGLSLQQVVEGLQDGLWEPTDEIMGPNDADWVAIENHPQLAEIAADLEPPPRKEYDDETRLDMNPLIDVALVLLIFFILTTTYSTLQRLLQMPDIARDNKDRPIARVKMDQIKDLVIQVTVRKDANGQPVIRVENNVVAENDLADELRKYVSNTRKTEMLLDIKDVSWGTFVLVQDAAKLAGIQRAHMKAN